MKVKVSTDIFLDVADHDQAQAACSTLESGLPMVMAGMPDAEEVLGVRVRQWEAATEGELQEHGFVE